VTTSRVYQSTVCAVYIGLVSKPLTRIDILGGAFWFSGWIQPTGREIGRIMLIQCFQFQGILCGLNRDVYWKKCGLNREITLVLTCYF